MIVKLKLASSKDTKPTITSKSIQKTGEVILLKFDAGSIYFHLSRDGKTYYANDWKKRFGLPKVGEPLDFKVNEILEYKQQKLDL